MGRFSGCLLACDIDGTLILGDYLPQRNIEKIAEFVKEGGYFSLASGRSVDAARGVLEKIKDYVGPSVMTNGNLIYDYKNEKIIYDTPIADDIKAFILNAADNFTEVGLEIHSGRDTFIYKEEKELRDHQKYENTTPKMISREDALKLDVHKTLFCCENPDVLLEVDKFFNENCKNAVTVEVSADIGGTRRVYREVLALGNSKASMLKKLCEILSVKEDRFFAIGDYYNDIAMLKAAHISACPNDSFDEVKSVCNYHTVKAKDGAVADFIDYLSNKEI